MGGNLGGWTGIILILVVIAIHIWLAILIGNVAKRKGRSKTAFIWLTLLVGPIIMGIIVAAISDTRGLGDTSLTSRLQEIEKLRDSGVISQDEFEKKKADLLEKM